MANNCHSIYLIAIENEFDLYENENVSKTQSYMIFGLDLIHSLSGITRPLVY